MNNLRFATLLILSAAACSDEDEPSPFLGTSTAISIVADGTFDPNTPPPELPGAAATSMPGRWRTDYVDRVVLGWDDSGIAADDAEAVRFFATRYGIDPTAPELADRVSYIDTVLDPRTHFRVSGASTFAVPPEGIPAWNTARIVVATDPTGVPLGGDHEGEVLPQGGALLYGAYVFASPRGLHRIAYWSLVPAVVRDGALVWTCEIESDEFGSGVAQGSARLTPDGQGSLKADIRNHLTFW
jgi:hypothetical protein